MPSQHTDVAQALCTESMLTGFFLLLFSTGLPLVVKSTVTPPSLS